MDILFPVLGLPQNIKLNQTLFCAVCRARLPNNAKICHRNSQYKLGAAANYDHEFIKKSIWQLKYRGKAGNAILLADLLSQYFLALNISLKNCVVVPIPLHLRRFRRRGFNQSELLAKYFAEKLNLPVEKSSLARVKDTPPQAETEDWGKREENIAGCFQVLNSNLKNKNVILIDDVYTSGSTLSEAAKVLKSNGAKQIIGLVVAKAG